MSYFRRVVKKRPVSMTLDECENLRQAALRWAQHFAERDGLRSERVPIRRVLCWRCRAMHSPAEVETCMPLPEKPAPTAGSTSSTSSALAPGPLKEYSELWGFLSLTAYPDGRKRRPGKISLSCDAGLLGLSLMDDETGQYAFLNGKDLDNLLTEAELRLADGTLSFKVSKYSKRSK